MSRLEKSVLLSSARLDIKNMQYYAVGSQQITTAVNQEHIPIPVPEGLPVGMRRRINQSTNGSFHFDGPTVFVPSARRFVGDQEYLVVNAYFADKLLEQGALPLPISSELDHGMRRRVYEYADGFGGFGGENIHPSLYGQEPIDPGVVARVDETRDSTESESLLWTIEDGKPAILICRLMQLFAAIRGGELHQRLSLVTDMRHGVSEEEPDPVFPSSIFHAVEIFTGTNAHEIFNSDTINVPSRHGQGVNKENPGDITVSGVAPDGTPEIVELGKKVMGVQFHPEYVKYLNSIFQWFVHSLS